MRLPSSDRVVFPVLLNVQHFEKTRDLRFGAGDESLGEKTAKRGIVSRYAVISTNIGYMLCLQMNAAQPRSISIQSTFFQQGDALRFALCVGEKEKC